LDMAHTSQVIHQLYILQLINPLSIPSSPIKASDSIKPFPSNPSHCFFSLPHIGLKFPLNLQSPHRVDTLQHFVQPFSSNAHDIADLLKISCALSLNKVVLPTGILAVSETFVMIQSVLASGFYSQDRQYFAQYFITLYQMQLFI